jgi:hypothetical protein
MIRDECAKHELPYVDTSTDFPGAIRQATDCLVAVSDDPG